MSFIPVRSKKVAWGLILSFLVLVAAALTIFLPQPMACTVRDAENGTPIRNAFVWVDDLEGPQGLTDQDGGVLLKTSRLPHTVFVSAPNHVDASIRFSLGYELFHWRRSCFVDLDPTQARVEVVDAITHLPLNNAVVRIDGTKAQYRGDGAFVQLRLSEGEHRVEVTAPRYHQRETSIFISRTSFKDESVKVELMPFKYCARVLGIGGVPLSGVKVNAAGKSARTDKSGIACFYHLPKQFGISFVHPAYLEMQRRVTFTDETTQDFSLKPRVLKLRIWDPWKGEGIEGAEARVDGVKATSDSSGKVVLEPVPLTATVYIKASPYVSVSLPVANAPYTVSLKPDGIKVTVVDEITGKPLSGAVASRGECRWKGSRNGRLLLPKGVKGEHVTIDAPGYFPKTVVVPSLQPLVVRVSPSHLSGVLLDSSTGKSVPGARILVPGRVFEAPKGAFELTNLPAGGDLIVVAPGYKVLYIKGNLSGQVKPMKGKCSKPPCVSISLERFEPKLIYINYGILNDRNKLKYYVSFVEKSPVLNGFVVDAKGDKGYIAWKSKVPMVAAVHSQGSTTVVSNFDWLLQQAKKKHLYVVARFVVFKDTPIATYKPELAAKKSDGTVWFDRIGAGWSNPYKAEVQNYNLALLKELASKGVDEIQLDYIRFPSDGNIADIVYGTTNTKASRTAAIRNFVRSVRATLRPYPVFLSVDTFGLTVWVYPYEDMSIGQRVIDLAPYIDYLCPMLYPSTFIPGNLGYQDPPAHPYEVIYRSVVRARKLLPPTAKVRPWLQAYWYDLKSMQAQRKAAEDAQSCGWSFWNALGVYSQTLFAK